MVDQLAELKDADRSLFPGSYTIRALRDSRYHNTAYAIAELIDNSIEAASERIELLCMERIQHLKTRNRRVVCGIAVLDNGEGMDPMTLLEALKFGGGTRHASIRGIGKYGMGLPTSSMSQCKRVDVWTWQNGIESSWHSSIDVDSIEKGNHEVPIPDQDRPVPEVWMSAGSKEIFKHKTGTLVVWSELDKIRWVRGRTVIENTSREVGRIHRYFLDLDMTRIRTVSFLDTRPNNPDFDNIVTANDPIYLMNRTSVPEEPWNNEPMFTQWGKTEIYPVRVGDREERIEVKYSIVKPEALKTDRVTSRPGDAPRGKHAKHNIGVSVLREDREIVLEGAFQREGGSAENPQNRWWGCEVHFRKGCDELFGVDHNKQMVAHFTEAAKTLARDDRPNQAILDELGIEDDVIHRIVGDIRDQTRAMMREIRQMFNQRRNRSVGVDGNRKNPENAAVDTATRADKEAIEAGDEKPTTTDRERENIPPTKREEGLKEQFIKIGQSDQDAQELAKMIVREGRGYQFNSAQLDGYQIFNVRSNHGVLHINLNMDHPVYDLIKQVEGRIDESIGEDDAAFMSIVAIRLLLQSWARMEDQTESREARRQIQDVAISWGRQVNKMISYLIDRED